VTSKQSIFDQAGGRQCLVTLSSNFYDKIYADPWMKQYFQGIPQEHIEKQQVDFMQAALGGPNKYAGKTPPAAHKHIFITDEVFNARQAILMDSFKECQTPQVMIDQWIKIEAAFYGRVVKKTIDECEMRYKVEGIRDFANPRI